VVSELEALLHHLFHDVSMEFEEMELYIPPLTGIYLS